MDILVYWFQIRFSEKDTSKILWAEHLLLITHISILKPATYLHIEVKE